MMAAPVRLSKTPKRRSVIEGPLLTLVDFAALRRRTRRRQLLFAAFVAVIIALFAVALVQALLVQKQHELDVLRSEVRLLETDNAKLERRVAEASSPPAILARAAEIGMVRAEGTVFLPAVRASSES